jgi:hypothetical protein
MEKALTRTGWGGLIVLVGTVVLAHGEGAARKPDHHRALDPVRERVAQVGDWLGLWFLLRLPRDKGKRVRA